MVTLLHLASRPDGQHTVSLEKDLRIARISKLPKSKPALGASGTGGGVGVGPVGCLDWSSFIIVVILILIVKYT